MNERQERIERLAERWFAAGTTDAEERELREWLREAEEVPAALRDVQAMLAGLDALAEERLPAGRRVPSDMVECVCRSINCSSMGNPSLKHYFITGTSYRQVVCID